MWEALLAQDLAGSLFSRLLLAVRGYGARAHRGEGGPFPAALERFGFTRLEESPGRELVFGLAGRFWRPDGGLRRISDGDAFREFAEPGSVKVAWNLRVGEGDGESCEISTETRIADFGGGSRRKFRLYWMLIGPFSGAIRIGLLRSVRLRAEQGRA